MGPASCDSAIFSYKISSRRCLGIINICSGQAKATAGLCLQVEAERAIMNTSLTSNVVLAASSGRVILGEKLVMQEDHDI